MQGEGKGGTAWIGKQMYKLSYGLFILTAKEAEKDNGCIINTAIQAASEPNQLSICVNKSNYTHDMIQRTGKFTVSVLSQKAQFELFKHFFFFFLASNQEEIPISLKHFEQCARNKMVFIILQKVQMHTFL